MQLLNVILFWIFFGLFCSFLANRRGKNPLLWFFIGIFLGIFGVLLIIFMPLFEKKKEAAQKNPSQPPSLLPPPRNEWNQLWYYLDASRKTNGPIAFPELHSLWKTQGLNENSYLWAEGMENWKKVHELSDLLEDLNKN